MVDFGTTHKILAVCQSEEVSISSGRNLVSQLCDNYKKHPYGRQKNQDDQTIAWVPVSTRYLNLP